MVDLLEVRDLKASYRTAAGRATAVDGVSFTVIEGRSLGLIGESGCGKTTLGRAIMRVMPRNMQIDGGQISFKGQDLVALSEQQVRNLRWRQISMIPQSSMASLDPVYRLEDQFLEVLCERGGMGKQAARRRAAELFGLVGLDPGQLNQYPHEFSGGMKQRAVIAMALALHPSLVIADEPVTALDVIVQEQVLGVIRDLQKRLGISVIMITHDMSVVAQTCQDVVVMYAGHVVESRTGHHCLPPARPPLHDGAYPRLSKSAPAPAADRHRRALAERATPSQRLPLCLALPLCPGDLPERAAGLRAAGARPLCGLPSYA